MSQIEGKFFQILGSTELQSIKKHQVRLVEVVLKKLKLTCQVGFGCKSISSTEIHFKGSFTKTFYCLILILLIVKRCGAFGQKSLKTP